MTDRIALPGWNGWELHPGIPALIYMGPRKLDYCIDLDRMLTRDQFGWWVFQTYDKGWGADALAGFVAATDDVLDLQRNAEFTAESMRRQVDKFMQDEQ